MISLFAKAALAWIVIAAAETLHGILRVRFLNRRFGDRRARRIGVLSGSVIILLLGWFLVPWIDPRSAAECAAVGALWVVLMLAFDFGLGRCVFRFSWRRILAEFDLRNGGFLGLGMLVLLLTPWLIARMRGLP